MLAAGVILLVDFCLSLGPSPRPMIRCSLALIGLFGYGFLTQWDPDTLGLNAHPIPGWTYWIKATLLIGGAVGTFALLVFVVWTLAEWELPRHSIAPRYFWPAFLHACIYAPVVEEAIYRFVLCVPACAVSRPVVAITLSGCIFAALHFAYGNPAPDNFIAGFFLAWGYLRSGSILIPVLLHSLGNFCALLFKCGVYLW